MILKVRPRRKIKGKKIKDGSIMVNFKVTSENAIALLIMKKIVKKSYAEFINDLISKWEPESSKQ